MRFKSILLENVVLNATKPVVVQGEQAQAVEMLGLTNSLEDWAFNRYSKWVIQVKEANQNFANFIGSESVKSWYTGVLVKYILKDKENKFLPIAPPHLGFDKIPHKDEIKGLNWAIENGELNQIKYFPADDGKINQDLRNQLEEAEHFFTSLMYDIHAQPHIPGNSDEATTKRLMQVHKQQKTNAEKLLKNIARSPMDQLLQQWAKYNQKRPTVKAEQIEDQTKVHEEGNVSFWKLESENAFKATGSALKNCIGSMYHYKPDEYDMYVVRDKGTEQAAICIQTNPEAQSGYWGGVRGGEVPAVRENKGYNNRPTPAIYTDEVINFFRKIGVKGVMGAGQRDNGSMGLVFEPQSGFKNIRKEFPLNRTKVSYKLDDTYTVALPSEALIAKIIDIGLQLGEAKIKYRTVNKEETPQWQEKIDGLEDQFVTYIEFVSKQIDRWTVRSIVDRWANTEIDENNLKNSNMEAELEAKIVNVMQDYYTIIDSKDRALIEFHTDNKVLDKWNILIDSRAPFLSHIKHLHDAGLIESVDKDIERRWLDQHGVVKGKKGAYHPYMEKYSPKKIAEAGNYTLWKHTGSPSKIDQYWDVNDKKGDRYTKGDSFKEVADEWRRRHGDNGIIKMRFYYIGDSSGRPMAALGVGDQKVDNDRYSWRVTSPPKQPIKNILASVLVAVKPKIRATAGDHESELIVDPDPERGIIWKYVRKSSEIEHMQQGFQDLLPLTGKIEHLGDSFRKLAYMIGWGDNIEDTIDADLKKGWREGRHTKDKTHLGLNAINSNRALLTLKPATQKKVIDGYMTAMQLLHPTYDISARSRYRAIKYGSSYADINAKETMFLSNINEMNPENQAPSLDIGMKWIGASRPDIVNDWHVYAKIYDQKKEVYNMMKPQLDNLWKRVQDELASFPTFNITFGQDFATIFAPEIKKWKDTWYLPFMKKLDDKQVLGGVAGLISPDLGVMNHKVEKDFGIEPSESYGPTLENSLLKPNQVLPWLEMAREHAMGDPYGPVGQDEAERYNKAMKAWHMGIGGTKHEGPEPGSNANLMSSEDILKLITKKYKEEYLPKLYQGKPWKWVFGSSGKSFKSRIPVGSIDHVDELRTYTMGQDKVDDPTYFMGYGHWADRSSEQFLIARDLQKQNPEMDLPGITPEMREKILADNT